MAPIYGPAVRSKKISTILRLAVLHQCIRPLLGAYCAPGHHGYQRACDLISGQASTGPLGPPVFACAGKTDFSIVVSSSRRPRRVDYIIEGSSFHGCSFVRTWWPFLRPDLRVQTRRAQGPSRLAVAQALPLASMLPGHALYGPEHGARIRLDGTPPHRSCRTRRRVPC